jgi:hypothetical protein
MKRPDSGLGAGGGAWFSGACSCPGSGVFLRPLVFGPPQMPDHEHEPETENRVPARAHSRVRFLLFQAVREGPILVRRGKHEGS